MTQISPLKAEGLYDPRFEHDACGVAMVARLDNEPSHEAVQRALEALDNLEHRGAEGADVRTGDGAGILTQVPDAFFRPIVDFELPAPGCYGVGVCFLPHDPAHREKLEQLVERNIRAEGQVLLGWRDVPIDEAHVGETANASRPHIRQVFVGAGPAHEDDQDAFERKLYVIRRIVELAAGPDFYASSFSSRTCVYKGMLISHQLRGFYPDLRDERFASGMALVHSRFSTNTFPSWELAHPYRVICHNGEINTLMGNVNWMRARESSLASELFGRDLAKVMPIVRPGGSDSATFDNVLELLSLAGRSLPHSVMMMIPEAYRDRDDLTDELKGFYAYHSCLMEPWDGPAAVAFTNGRVVGATLDRNGLRPGRWMETKDGWVVLGSETGMLGIEPGNVKRLGRLQPGKLFLVDLEQGRIVEDDEVKREVATQKPYAEWFRRNVVHFNDLERAHARRQSELPLRQAQLAFGYSQEDLRVLMAPMVDKAEEPIGSMGNDAALAVLSDQRPALFTYFKQLFAQVTNPPIDPIREAIVMSLGTGVGAEGNLLDESPEHAHQLVMEQPILRNHELETLRHVGGEVFRAHTIDITWPVAEGPEGMQRRLADVCDEAYDAHPGRGQRPDHLRPRRRPRAGADPVAAGRQRRAPPPRARGHAPARRPRARVGRAARGAPFRHADRLRRERDQPLRDARHDRRADRAGRDSRRRRPRRGRAPRGQGPGQGAAQDDLQDGDLDDPVLLRGPDLRGRGAGEDARRPPLHRHGVADRRRRPRGPRPGGAGPPRPRVAGRPGRPAAGRRRLRLAARRRAPHVEPRDDLAAAARGEEQRQRQRRTATSTATRRRSTTSTRARSTTTRRAAPRCAACSASAPTRSRSRSTRSSRPARSSSASPPARCRWARSPPRRTRRWPWP